MSSHASSSNRPSSSEAPSQTAQYNQNVDADGFMDAVTAFQNAQKAGNRWQQVRSARTIISSLYEDERIDAAKVDAWGGLIDISETNNAPFPPAVAKEMEQTWKSHVQSNAW